MKVAILGAGGQIGRTLLERLRLDSNLQTIGIVRNALTAGPLRLAGLDVRVGSVAAEADRSRLIDDCDVIVNCASASAQWGQARIEDRAITDAMLKTRARIIHFSSVAVYGTCIDPQRNTFDAPRPDYPWGRDKLNLERYTRESAKAAGKRLVILRLGHVYGAEQWVSKFVIDRLGVGFKLPFGGQNPSNAIHVSNVASAIRTLVHDANAEGTFNLFDPGQSSWRQVFDWNTSAVGAPAFLALDHATSQRCETHYRAAAKRPVPLAIAREVTAWAKSAPLSLVGASPSLRDALLSTMSSLRTPWVEQRMLRFFGETNVRKLTEPLPIAQPWLLSDGAPGPALSYKAEVAKVDQDAVATWHRALTSPDALWTPDEEPMSPIRTGGQVAPHV